MLASTPAQGGHVLWATPGHSISVEDATVNAMPQARNQATTISAIQTSIKHLGSRCVLDSCVVAATGNILQATAWEYNNSAHVTDQQMPAALHFAAAGNHAVLPMLVYACFTDFRPCISVMKFSAAQCWITLFDTLHAVLLVFVLYSCKHLCTLTSSQTQLGNFRSK